MNRYQSQRTNPRELQSYLSRFHILVAFVIILALTLTLRLAYLQFSQYRRFATLSLKNQMSILPIAPSRGIIYDKNGVVLADNIPVYVLEITPEHIKSMSNTIGKLQELLPSITADDIKNFYRAGRQNPAYVPIPLKLKLSQEEVATFASNQYQFPGVNIKAVLMRSYPLGEITAHLLGYVGRINPEELRKVDATQYRATNFIGKSGIEKYYESQLHGQVGYQQSETDVNGRTLRILNKQSPVSGNKLYLTIDTRLQTAGYKALQDKRGAIIILSTTNGDILSMVSAPSFNPNLFVNGISSDDYKLLSNEQDRPLYNRAVRGLYPPASAIKPFIAIAGLDKGVANPQEHIFDPGWYRLPGVKHIYRDWKHHGHGFINLKRAIAVSCDTYFYQLSSKLGINAMEDTLTQFGFGQLTHVDLLEETAGIVPSPHWKRQTKGLPWYPGDTVITSIGQGFMLATPLQLANATAALSHDGRRFRPHLLRQSVQDHNHIKHYNRFEEYPLRLKSKKSWGIVKDAMHAVITNKESTGRHFGRDAPYSVAAKTGTAQVFSLNHEKKNQYANVPFELRDHSLFIAFAPVENPEVAIAVIVEHDTMAPQIARRMLDTYFDLKEQDQFKAQP
ncbi:MAG: penicillin-binding protein 2 [Gammaproteobacteria bacterium]|nr:penicillin-binding protein 2 [Gammaproteobacteria bacterium]